MSDGVPAIRIRNLQKSFGENRVLENVNIDVEPGEILIVVGLSGSGKSVLLKHLIRLIEPDSGSIEIEGADLLAMDEQPLNQYLQNVGMVFQHAALFDSMSTGQNIMFPILEHNYMPPDQAEARARELLRRVRMPDAFDRNPADLSGGMKKRAGLARGLALGPKFVYFDEPMAGLDMVTGVVIQDLILETHREFGYTGVVITHHWDMAQRLGDRVALLWNGRIHATGTPAELESSTDRIVQGFLNRDPSVLAEA